MAAAVACKFNDTSHKEVAGVDDHTHECPKCGTKWSHQNPGNKFTAKKSAHQCPCCGTLQYDRTDGNYSGPG